MNNICNNITRFMFFSEFLHTQIEWLMLNGYIVCTAIFHVIKSLKKLKNIKFLNNCIKLATFFYLNLLIF